MLSSIDLNFSKELGFLRTEVIRGRDDPTVPTFYKIALRELESMQQVVHLTTAIFLLIAGPIIEQSKWAQLAVLLVTLLVCFIKVYSGFFMYLDAWNLTTKYVQQNIKLKTTIWYWLTDYQLMPLELFFAASDAIRYIQFVYLAKWINRKNLIMIMGLWFSLIGLSETVSASMKMSRFNLMDYVLPQPDDPSKYNLV